MSFYFGKSFSVSFYSQVFIPSVMVVVVSWIIFWIDIPTEAEVTNLPLIPPFQFPTSENHLFDLRRLLPKTYQAGFGGHVQVSCLHTLGKASKTGLTFLELFSLEKSDLGWSKGLFHFGSFHLNRMTFIVVVKVVGSKREGNRLFCPFSLAGFSGSGPPVDPGDVNIVFSVQSATGRKDPLEPVFVQLGGWI